MGYYNEKKKRTFIWFELVTGSVLLLSLLAIHAKADDLPTGELTSEVQSEPHKDQNWSVHAQATVVSQGSGKRNEPYSGDNSLRSDGEIQTSLTSTLFLGRKLWSGAEIYANPEVSAGSGLSKSTGLAGFSNGEVYRVDSPDPKLSLSRLYYQQVIGLGGGQEFIEADKNQLARTVDKTRLTVVAGKFALNDYLDNNSYSHDPRTQFLNWALMDNGAWDYAADTRGYSWGLYAEYNQPRWALRGAVVLVPEEANKMAMDTNIARAHGDNAEFEYRYSAGHRPGAIRILGYMNHAHMGNYRQTIANPDALLKIENTRDYSLKYGGGINIEQELSSNWGVFGRASLNDGQTETWAFTEIDRALSLGTLVRGSAWGRINDTAGLALVVNGLSKDHADYLSSGGYGFIVGDGQLNYAPEQIVEAFYQFKPIKSVALAANFQAINNPAYNQDRGPATIVATRLHYEF